MAVVPALLATPSAALGDSASSAPVTARPTHGDDVLEDHGGSILCPRAGHSAPGRGYPGLAIRSSTRITRGRSKATNSVSTSSSGRRFTTTLSPRSSRCSQSVQRRNTSTSLANGIQSRFPTQAVRLFSFHRNLGSIVAVGSARLESPWLRAR